MEGIMEQNVAGESTPASMVPESGENSHSDQEGPGVCPLCSSKVSYFAINFHEKFLMCENTDCEFPFGHEELQFAKMSGDELDDDIMNDNASFLSTPASTILSMTALSDIDRLSTSSLHPVCKTDDQLCHIEEKLLNMTKKPSGTFLSNNKQEKKTKKILEDLKGVTVELNHVTSSRNTITNEKYIKTLMHLQDQSGQKLLRPEEMKKLNKMEKVRNNLKIDVELGDGSCMSSIKIDIGDSKVADKSDENVLTSSSDNK